MKPEWGSKRACRKCLAYFYDMNKTEFECPKCHASFTLQDYAVKTHKNVEFPYKKEGRKKSILLPIEEEIENIDVEIDIDDNIDQEDLIEDTSDLDTEDVHDVIKHDGLDEH